MLYYTWLTLYSWRIYREGEDNMLAARTDKQKDSQEAYMEKLQDIKVRVPKEYYDKIKDCAEKKRIKHK